MSSPLLFLDCLLDLTHHILFLHPRCKVICNLEIFQFYYNFYDNQHELILFCLFFAYFHFQLWDSFLIICSFNFKILFNSRKEFIISFRCIVTNFIAISKFMVNKF